ncbi:pirin family protein [Acidocella facilis]|uniref:pirin family protein n=1 Tax=Acidocella facilis TaxID=525 RepID=UPI00047A42D2|nr:pirin family protein [Acidocella facilis]
MSWLHHPSDQPEGAAALVITPVSHDIGGLRVRRALPHASQRMVGPFVFLDHIGPAQFEAGHGLDVRPHPHIGLATLTYLMQGCILHRDTLGSAQEIRPGAVNWMTAGRGIAHSERSPEDARRGAQPILGIQSWVALPKAHEEAAPGFFHHEGTTLPQLEDGGIVARIIAGRAYGATAPVKVFSDTLYVDVSLGIGSALPLPDEHEERSVQIIAGEVEIAGERFGEGQFLVFRPGDAITIRALADSRLMLLGGEALDGPRHIWWNFVSSSKERIEQAKQDWVQRRFGLVPGDDQEFIPLPGSKPVGS